MVDASWFSQDNGNVGRKWFIDRGSKVVVWRRNARVSIVEASSCQEAHLGNGPYLIVRRRLEVKVTVG